MSSARDTTRVGDEFFRLHRNSAALLIVDMQNGFLEPGAMLEVAAGREIVPRVAQIIEHCRAAEIPIVWIQLDSRDPFGGLMLDKYPPLREQQVLFKGTHSYDLYAELPQPQTGEYHVVKHKYDAFHRTDLDTLLRNLNVDTVIITGVTSNCCCESTARSAFEHDYKVAFTSDGTAAFEPRLHEGTLGLIRELFGRVLSVDEAIAELN
jgi:nicotinamidase-related amidase